MPRRTTEKQRAASRRNARKSTGPRTPEGKARSSKNALKHGLLAREAVITSGLAAENPAEFQALLADLREELRPEGVIQETLVERMATCYWRLRRAQRLEIAAIHGTLDKPAAATPDSIRVAKIERSVERAAAKLRQDEGFLKTLANPPDLSVPDQRADFHSFLTQLAESFDIETADRSDDDLLTALVTALKDAVADQTLTLEKLNARLADAKRDLELQQSANPPPSPRHDTLVRLVRYESMLDRQFHRALTELRRRQSARSRPKAKK